jgi:hypothetical protein
MSHVQTAPRYDVRSPVARPAADLWSRRLVRGWRFTVEVILDARAMEAKYRRENRTPFHGW